MERSSNLNPFKKAALEARFIGTTIHHRGLSPLTALFYHGSPTPLQCYFELHAPSKGWNKTAETLFKEARARKIYKMYMKGFSLYGNIEIRDQKGRTLLSWMAMKGMAKVVQRLLHVGADVEARDHDGWTALMWAAERNRTHIMHMLLNAGANKDARDTKDHTALMWAINSFCTESARILINAGANLEIRDHRGYTPLISAAISGQKDIVHMLVQAGANMEAHDLHNQTALIYAVAEWKETSAQILIQAKANLEARNHMDYTPLMSAAELGNATILHMLVQAGANPEAHNPHNWTALQLAAIKGHESAVDVLIEARAHLEATDKAHWTALMWAAAYGKKDVVHILIKAKANLEAPTRDGTTPLMKASSYEHNEVVQLLANSGAQINAHDNDGYTALTFAVSRQSANMIHLLEKLGADSKFNKKFLNIKLLAHAWGIEGTSKLIDVNNNPITFQWEGLTSIYATRMLSTYVMKFFASDEWARRSISQECQEHICACMASNIPKSSSEGYTEAFSKILSGKPVVIFGGFTHHTIGMVIGRNHKSQYQLIVCNRGAGGMEDETTTIYSIAPSKVTEQLLEDLNKNYLNHSLFNQMLAQLNLNRIDGYQQMNQFVGNCTLASSKAAFRAVCEWYTNRKLGSEIYKKFTHGFLREQLLIEYLDEYLETPYELDIPLLQTIKTKYLDYKPALFLSKETCEKLEQACLVQSSETIT